MRSHILLIQLRYLVFKLRYIHRLARELPKLQQNQRTTSTEAGCRTLEFDHSGLRRRSVAMSNLNSGADEMKTSILALFFGIGLGIAGVSQAQTTQTATCKDGTSWSGAQRSGACGGHGGAYSLALPPHQRLPPRPQPHLQRRNLQRRQPPRHQRHRQPRCLPPERLVRSGSTLPARSITALGTAGMVRPRKANT